MNISKKWEFLCTHHTEDKDFSILSYSWSAEIGWKSFLNLCNKLSLEMLFGFTRIFLLRLELVEILETYKAIQCSSHYFLFKLLLLLLLLLPLLYYFREKQLRTILLTRDRLNFNFSSRVNTVFKLTSVLQKWNTL